MSQLPAVVLQQVSDGDMFRHVLNDAVLGSSIYINIAVAGLTLLFFMYLGRNVSDPRGQLIVVSAMTVSAVSIVSYTGLASGLTISILEMPAGHGMAGETTTSGAVPRSRQRPPSSPRRSVIPGERSAGR